MPIFAQPAPRGASALVAACSLVLVGCPTPAMTTDAPADDAFARDVPLDTPPRDVPVTPDTPRADTPATDTPAMDTPQADAPPADVPRSDVPATDDVSRADVPTTSDVPRDVPAGDTATCDPARDSRSPAGVCDGRGRIACTMWAESHVTTGTAFAVCLSAPGMAGCARADACADIADPITCRCGAGPACAVGEVCAAASAGLPPSCRCVDR